MLAANLPVFQTPHGQAVIVTADALLANAGKANSSAEISIASLPTLGTLTSVSSGNWSFSPTPGETGIDSFSYLVTENGTPSDPYFADIAITNAAPIFAEVQPVTMVRGQAYPGSVATFTDTDDATGHTATITLDDGDPIPATLTPNSTEGFDITSEITCPTLGSHTLTITITDPLGATNNVAIQITVFQSAEELYSAYLDEITIADQSYLDATTFAAETRRYAELTARETTDLALDAAGNTYELTISAAQASFDLASDAISADYDAAMSAAETTKVARMDQADHAMTSAADAALIAEDQAAQYATEAYAQAITAADAAYLAEISPYQAIRDSAFEAAQEYPEDPALQDAYSAAESALAAAIVQAEATRTSSTFLAQSDRDSALQLAALTFTNAIEFAENSWQAEAVAAEAALLVSKEAAWTAYLTSRNGAADSRQQAFDYAEDAYENASQLIEIQNELEEGARKLNWQIATEASQVDWHSRENLAWEQYLEALNQLPGTHTFGARITALPAVIDEDATYYFTSDVSPTDPPSPASMQAADIDALRRNALSASIGNDAQQAALTLIDVIEQNSTQRSIAYDALLSALQRWKSIFMPAYERSDPQNIPPGDRPALASAFAAFTAVDARLAQRFAASTDNDVRGRFAALQLTIGNLNAAGYTAALNAISAYSASAANGWAGEAIAQVINRVEQELNYLVNSETLIYQTFSRITSDRPQIREVLPAGSQLDRTAPPVYANDAIAPAQRFEAAITAHYVNYARRVLFLLDYMPQFSLRNRLLNAVEIVNGKLIADGQMIAAATILQEEAIWFRDNVAGAETAWKNQVADLLLRQADTFREFAPGRVNNAVGLLNTAVDAARTYLSSNPAGVNAADRDVLATLANQSAVQGEMLRANAANISANFTIGLIGEFRRLAIAILDRQFRGRMTTTVDATGASWTRLERGAEHATFTRKIGSLADALVTYVRANGALVLNNVRVAIQNNGQQIVPEETQTFGEFLESLRTSSHAIDSVLLAMESMSGAFYYGNDAALGAAHAALAAALRAGGRLDLADAQVDAAGLAARSQAAMGNYLRMVRDQRFAENLEATTTFVTETVVREGAIMLATSVLSCGTVTAIAAAWRLSTGVILSSRAVFAAEIVMSFPIQNTVDRIRGVPTDDTFLGVVRQATVMAGFASLSRVMGIMGRRAAAGLRATYPSLFGTQHGVLQVAGVVENMIGRLPRLSARWGAKAITDTRFSAGNCKKFAEQIQRLIGGDLFCIKPAAGTRNLTAYRGQALGWLDHWVVVKNGRVYDPFTGHQGETIAAYKALWAFSTELSWPF